MYVKGKAWPHAPHENPQSRIQSIRFFQCFFICCTQTSFDFFHVFAWWQTFRANTALYKVSRTAWLFVTCSLEITASLSIWCCLALKMVISAAKSFAFRMMVGAKSANGRLSGTCHYAFMACVVLPKSAWSPLLRIKAKSWLLPVCS